MNGARPTETEDADLRIVAMEMARIDQTRERFNMAGLLERSDFYYCYFRSGMETALTHLPPTPRKKRGWLG